MAKLRIVLLIFENDLFFTLRSLQKFEALREVMTDLRVGAENIINQNDELTHVNSDLEAQAQR